MPIAILLTLASDTDALLTQPVGRAHYAEVLARLAAVDPALSAAIHDGAGPKPLTCSGLLNARATRDGTAIAAGQSYFLRVTGLTPPVVDGLAAALLQTPLSPWTVAGHAFRVLAASAEAGPWSGRTTYEALAADHLLPAAAPDRTVTLRFASPTGFKATEGMHVPLPLPSLVFGSLVDRWNAFSPVRVSPEMRRFAAERIAISRYSLHSRPAPQRDGSVRMGGVGTVTYRALGGDRYWVGVMQMLASYALYSGVGVSTTVGMGQVRRAE